MTSNRLPRKLAAILYADVVGYSRLTGEDEDATHLALSQYLVLISTTVESQRGRVMHYAGDAVLAKFPTVIQALSCAVGVQKEIESSPAAGAIRFRMGVHMDDVIVDRDEVYGEGVNTAVRLQDLAQPGGICINPWPTGRPVRTCSFPGRATTRCQSSTE